MTAPTEDPRVPWYIDAQARHRAKTMRLLAYMGLAGREGVMGAGHCKVTALSTPGAAVQIAPGAWGVLARHAGGDFEAYTDKLQTALVRAVSPTDATPGGRTDLVVLRVLNPNVTEVGSSIGTPADPQNGPYWDVVVVEGVTPNLNTVTGYNPNWSAIPLARIVRPASTGIVQQNQIVELRSLVDLSGERIVILDTPPAIPPPIAQQVWTGVVPCVTPSSYPKTQTTFINWPSQAAFSVPIPSWAKTCDVQVLVNPEINGNVYGEMRLTLDDVAVDLTPTLYNYNFASTIGPEQYLTAVFGSFTVPAAKAGKIVTLRTQGRSLANDTAHPGVMSTHAGCYVSMQLNFKKAVA